MNKRLIAVLVTIVFSTLACGTETPIEQVGEVSVEEEPVEASEPEESPTLEESPMPVALTTYQVGDVIAAGNLEMVVYGWSSPPGDKYTFPEDGNIFVIVDVGFENKGSESESVSVLLQMTVKDSAGRSYADDFEAQYFVGQDGGASAPEGELVPGEVLRGPVGFQVPADVGVLTFVFEPGVFDFGKVFVELPAEPTQ